MRRLVRGHDHVTDRWQEYPDYATNGVPVLTLNAMGRLLEGEPARRDGRMHPLPVVARCVPNHLPEVVILPLEPAEVVRAFQQPAGGRSSRGKRASARNEGRASGGRLVKSGGDSGEPAGAVPTRLVLQCAMCGTHHPVGTSVCATCRASGVTQLRLMFECPTCGQLGLSPVCATCPPPLELDDDLILADEVMEEPLTLDTDLAEFDDEELDLDFDEDAG